jgi:hypothetical protein
MKILFINSKKFDYSQDLTYAGLVAVLGKACVRDYPRNFSYHFDIKKYPKNMGRSKGSFLDFFQSENISVKNCDAVLVGCPKPDALEAYLKICKDIPSSTPVIMVDGGDKETIGGDATRLGRPELWQEAIRKRNWDFVFKREFMKNKSYPPHILPLPFCMNLEALQFTPKWQYDKLVSFWASESHPIRTKALEILAGQFDCDQNGTSKNKKMSHFTYKGKRYSEELAKCRIALSLRGGGWDTLRYWEIPAHGPLMVSQRLDIVIPNDFEDRKQIVFCNDDLSDLIDICKYYLAHEDESLKIAQAAYEHLKIYHTHIRRAEYILQSLGLPRP